MTVHTAASREADGRAGSKAYRYPGAIAQAVVRNRLNPGGSRSGRAVAKLMGLAVGCPKGMGTTHRTNLNHHREVTVFTAE